MSAFAARRGPFSSSAETSAISRAAKNACTTRHPASRRDEPHSVIACSLTSSTAAPRTRSTWPRIRPAADFSPARGTRPSLRKDQAAQRLAAAVYFDDARRRERVRQLAQPDRARRQPFVVGDFCELGNFAVELVANLAEQFLEQIFERHQAQQTAVLVDHQRDLKAPAAHLVEQIGERFARRNEICAAAPGARRAAASAFEAARRQILGVQNADDIVRAVGDRPARARNGRARFPPSTASAGVSMSSAENPLARRHHLGRAARAEIEHPMNHRALGGLDLTLMSRRAAAAP